MAHIRLATHVIFRQQENLVDQKCQAGFWPLCNKIPYDGKFVWNADCRYQTLM